MAYKLTWSPAARDDLHDIVLFIARDNLERAMSFGYELISETDRLPDFPDLGRIVPNIKIKRFAKSSFVLTALCIASNTIRRLCEIARVWHSARGIPVI